MSVGTTENKLKIEITPASAWMIADTWGRLLGTYEIRSETGNAGTGMYRQGADEHGCEFAPVAGSIYTFIEFPMSLTALSRIW